MLIRVFLHAEFISAMKIVQIPTIFRKNKEMNNFVNFSQFFEIFTETHEQNIRKSQ